MALCQSFYTYDLLVRSTQKDFYALKDLYNLMNAVPICPILVKHEFIYAHKINNIWSTHSVYISR